MSHIEISQKTGRSPFIGSGFSPFYFSSLLLLSSGLDLQAQPYTRGIGVYPGDPKENFAPMMKIDSVHYRNLALHRAVYQSSAYDYNLTSELITDGIIDTALPGWIVTSTSSSGILPRDGREHILDRHASSQQALEGAKVWVEVQMAGNYALPPVDSLNFSGSLTIDTLLPLKHWEITVSGSNEGSQWDPLGQVSGDSLPGTSAMNDFLKRFPRPPGQQATPEQMNFIRRFAPVNRRVINYGFRLSQPVSYRYYRLSAADTSALRWSVSDLGLLYEGIPAPIGGPYAFTSAWKSGGSQEEWVYVDLGANCRFNRVKISWISSCAQGSIQVSSDATHWKDIATIEDTAQKMDDFKLGKEVKGRYVRVLMSKPVDPEKGYILSELEVLGRGGPVPLAHLPAPANVAGRIELSGGSWKIQRASQTISDGNLISLPSFKDSNWMLATVPGTTLVSYLNDGAIPDPNYGDNNIAISDSYFYADFWYRDVFTIPSISKKRKVFLNFDGINWEADVFLNGQSIGHINGAFIRGKWDITDKLVFGGKNVLAVKIIKNDAPGFPTEQNRNSTDANGGELGADNPTFHASIGWDWIPTIRGRNTGIWNTVYLTTVGPVTIEDPFVSSHLPLPDTSSAEVSMEITLTNHEPKAVHGILKGAIGHIPFEQSVSLDSAESKLISLNPTSHPMLRIAHPRLWWPNGYGKQDLYNIKLTFITSDGLPSDSKKFETGIREMSYSDSGGALKIWVNGRRFIARGGNWGFSEDLLRYRAREYNTAVRYHQNMNFNMIRNWVGQVDDEAFYIACDTYGIMIWQDFWLANPSDGPDPIHPDMFIDNLKDYVRRIRNHPSVALFVGRNEGNPPAVLENAITAILPILIPGIKYIPNSAFGTVSGGGPYGLMPLKYYFRNRATPKLHSEMGMPDIMSYESFHLTMPDSAIWPQSRIWGVHDFTLQGAQNGGSFNKTVESVFGHVEDAKVWLSLAAWTQYQGYRAMFEAQSKNRMGLIIWMSHPSWPSLAWQSYDYYFEPTSTYFGAKKASEPLHVQWNPLSDSVEVVNYSNPRDSNLKVILQIIDLHGTVRLKKESALNCPVDSTISVMPVTLPEGLSPVYFVRLQLKTGDSLISQNDYCRGPNPDSSAGIGDLREIARLPILRLETSTTAQKQGDHWSLSTTLFNNTKYPAFNIRLIAVGDQTKKRILPVIYRDNYFTLLPGEKRTVDLQVRQEDTRGETPWVEVEGLNIE